ncbi:MAG TPA: hypothetical protein PKM23_01725 [bacterium]|nr:hypothetical protein [bacterium]
MLLFSLPAARADAAGPALRTWQSFADFITGRLDNLSLSADGRLTLAPSTTQIVDTGEPYVWDIASDAAGNLYLGTGNGGKVFRITPAGDTTLYFQAEEPEIYALAHDGRRSLYVATSPNGFIYRIDDGGKAALFCEPGQSYIWDLLCDPRGDLWAATGGKARLLRISPDGRMSVVFSSEAEHLRCLALDGEELFAGSSRPGLVYRIRKGQAPFVLYDSGSEEVHSLAVMPGGHLYAATMTPAGPEAAITRILAAAPAQSVSPEEAAEEKSGALQQPPLAGGIESAPAAKSQLLRIEADGYGRPIWPAGLDEVQALLPGPDGKLLVGTGREGRLYSIDSAGEISLLLKIGAAQIPTLHRTSAGEVILATANMGLACRVGPRVREGSFESETVDAAALTRWGALRWRGEGRMTFQTRSGNTRKPEASWSEWQPLQSSGGSWQIASPAARFLQWRCTLQGGKEEPALAEVNLAWLQQNRPPEIADLVVLPPGSYFEITPDPAAGTTGLSAPAPLPKRDQRKGWRSALWQFDDSNSDPLLFALWYRRTGDAHWRRLAGPLTQAAYSWDATQMADGEYELKLEASDSLMLPAGQGLRAEKISPPFVVDNTGPVIKGFEVENKDGIRHIRFSVCDAASPLARVRISINAGGWKPLSPVDGICDSVCEEFGFTLRSGEELLELSLEAADIFENSSMAHQRIKGSR